MTSTILRDKNIIDVVKYKWLWIAISAVLIVPGIIAMIYSSIIYHTHSPLKLGIDFTGGTLLQYGFEKQINSEDIIKMRDALKLAGIENPVVQVSDFNIASDIFNEIENKENVEITNLKSVVSIRTRFLDSDKANNETLKASNAIKDSVGEFVPLQVSSIGPTLSKELFKNAVVAMLLAFLAIVGYLTIRFQLDFAIFALLALLHDALFICGVFAILGLFFNTEIDSLFITAILTVIGFSVHDTIVVFDRIRENSRFLAKKKTFNEIVNASVNQTLARSINTSLTTLIVLLTLYFLGGETTKDFILAMILGIAIGTYSSIFNASTLLAMWRNRKAFSAKS
ncbi:MAG: protein translocase subunit SecF [Candidatus Gastranaerophilales bacterium]|nr:protein translocase subunit SecF [Candidatus Gastranaerophilales bacterium]